MRLPDMVEAEQRRQEVEQEAQERQAIADTKDRRRLEARRWERERRKA
jgi:hypothetical protein